MDIPQIVSPDGYIDTIAVRSSGEAQVDARFLFPKVSDYIVSALKEGKPWFFSGRSGNAQIGLLTDTHMPGDPAPMPEIDGSKILLTGIIRNLNPLLNNALDLFETGDEIGRLVVMAPELRIRDVRHYLHKRLFVGNRVGKGYYEGFDICQEVDPVTGQSCDYIEVALSSFQYCFEPAAMIRSSIGAVIKKGRSALNAIRSRVPMDPAKTMLDPGALFVGAVKISLGDIYGIIDAVVTPEKENIIHLPARVLDPFRTFRNRQVELFHLGKNPVPLSDIRIRVRFFRSHNPLTVPLEKARVQEGYRLCDLLTHVEVSNLFDILDDDAMGLILNKGNFIQVPRALDPKSEAQLEIIKNCLAKSTQRRHEPSIPKSIGDKLKETLGKLSVLGGVNSRVFIGRHFPEREVVDALRRTGLCTFLINAENPCFADDDIRHMINLSHAVHDRCEFMRYDPVIDKLYSFYHGCFMEPDDWERFDRVRFWFAFYGSHTKAADNRLTIDLINRLALRLGDEMGIVHGGGPGLMKEANDLARRHNIMSVGIAIELEGENQASLTTCDGLIKYNEGLRLSRQDHLQKLSNLPVINTGGYGSAEELSITITSMKIHENPLAPIILLDPDNLWEDARKQTQKIADKQYGPAFTPHLVKSCKNADQAETHVIEFLSDPDRWYKKNKIPVQSVEKARSKSARIRQSFLHLDNVEVFSNPSPRLSSMP